MVSVKKWFRGLRPCRHHRGQHQQNTTPDEKSQAPENTQDQISVTLCEPTIDPFVAAQLHNIKKCRLTRLPQELLLCILEHIGDDAVTLRCLRRVSRIFRRLIYDNVLWERIKVPDWCWSSQFMTETTSRLSEDEEKLLKQHLQSDGMCKNCRLWCDVPATGWLASLIQTVNLATTRQVSGYECKFQSKGPRLLCNGCGTRQSTQNFADYEKDPFNPGRRCLGRQGAVQLCEHVHILWEDIENHFAEWERRIPGEWGLRDWWACLEDFFIECHDPSHDRRCTAEESPTWPRASLRTGNKKRNAVLLSLEWSPHSGMGVFTRNADGRARAEDLRRLFRKFRRGTAEILFPSHRTNHLPEMACFKSDKCDCLYYNTEGIEMSESEKGSRHGLLAWFRANYPFLAESEHVHSTFRGYSDLWIEGVSMTTHWPTHSDSSCLITTYERKFFVFNREDQGTKKMNPGHAWFHAMDPESYPRPEGLELPFCNRKNCMNYFRRPKVFRCGSLALNFHH